MNNRGGGWDTWVCFARRRVLRATRRTGSAFRRRGRRVRMSSRRAERRDERVATRRRGRRPGSGSRDPRVTCRARPCYNGTCSNEPGSTDSVCAIRDSPTPACLIECGDPGFARVATSSRGRTTARPSDSLSSTSRRAACTSAVAGESTPPARRPGRVCSARRRRAVRVHVDGAVVFARVSPVRRRARRVRGERPGRRGLRQSVDHGDRVRTRLDGAPGGIPSPAVRRAESRKKLQRAVSPVRARDVPRRRDVPVRAWIRVAGTAVRGVGRGRDRSRSPVPAGGRSDGGVRAEVSHVRGEGTRAT